MVEDLCGDLDLRIHEAAMRRVEQAGREASHLDTSHVGVATGLGLD